MGWDGKMGLGDGHRGMGEGAWVWTRRWFQEGEDRDFFCSMENEREDWE